MTRLPTLIAAAALASLIGISDAHAFSGESGGSSGAGGPAPDQPDVSGPSNSDEGGADSYNYSGRHFDFSVRKNGDASADAAASEPVSRAAAKSEDSRNSGGFFDWVMNGISSLFGGGR